LCSDTAYECFTICSSEAFPMTVYLECIDIDPVLGRAAYEQGLACVTNMSRTLVVYNVASMGSRENHDGQGYRHGKLPRQDLTHHFMPNDELPGDTRFQFPKRAISKGSDSACPSAVAPLSCSGSDT